MKIKNNWNVGNFDVTLVTEVSAEQVETLVAKGILQVAQRQSEIDKVLGIVKKVGEKTVRTGTKRGEVEFKDAIADALKAIFLCMEVGDDKGKIDSEVTVTEYVPTAAGPKFAREKSLLAEKVAGGATLDAIAKKVGYEGDTTDEEGAYTTEFLASVKVFLDAVLKAGI
jgi:hypothetical protein